MPPTPCNMSRHVSLTLRPSPIGGIGGQKPNCRQATIKMVRSLCTLCAAAPLVHGLCTDGAMALHKTEKSLAIFFLQRDDTAIWHNGEREKAPVFSRNFLPFDVTSSNDRHFIYLSLLQPGFQQGRNLGSFPCHGNADSLKSSHFLFRRARTA